MSFRTDRVRLAILLKRNPTLTKEEFSQYWLGTHAALFSGLAIVKTNLLKYEQAHTNEPVLLQLAAAMGAPKSEWDGMAIFEAESYVKIFEIFQSEEYQKVVVPDEKHFIVRQASQALPLDLNTVLDQ
ncbi:hypothetical protein DFH07DRAFT_814474 [Mycena maculata]|uniref:EthD domain-containing protein n=1 Tax=Mycena maculata TaxID=230809 RepID=A0AAD7JCD0_9AGAR|nr:hypothetical protein DFH07DRAFT_814474 [Mycena maculata]